MHDLNVDVISLHPEFKKRVFKQYKINGVPTIGVFKDEPFFVRVTPSVSGIYGFSFAIDGVNLFSGKQADLDGPDYYFSYDVGDNPFDLRRFQNEYKHITFKDRNSTHPHVMLNYTGLNPRVFPIKQNSINVGVFTLNHTNSLKVIGSGHVVAELDSNSITENEVSQGYSTLETINPMYLVGVQSINYVWWDHLKDMVSSGQVDEFSGFPGFKQALKIERFV